MADPTRPSTNGMGCVLLFLLPFTAVGMLMSVLTVWCIVDWARIQRWVETPAVVDEPLAGVILLPGIVRPADGFRIELRCVRRVTTHKQSGEQVLFLDTPGAEPSDPFSDRHIVWKLYLSAKLLGPEANFEFEVPVFRRGETPTEHDRPLEDSVA